LPERVQKGKLSEEQVRAARAGLRFVARLEDAVGDADFVIEAISEDLGLKRELFVRLDQLCGPDAILATNSSFLASSLITDATSRPDKVVNMHFFNPALVMKLVEVAKGPHVSDDTIATTMELARRLDKNPILLKKEIYGFIVNRILAALNKEALFLLDQEIASAEDIDAAVEGGLGHPMGPFRLLDLTGVDLNYAVGLARYQETRQPADIPSPTLARMYATREWGRKTGVGFYRYDDESGGQG
ncbi:MAG: 3-hydroxyacyl-CoA dehydrogenase family protein, partial [Actinobacteria bacterium]|nr:3-hydroxyacyl-CoA dehydrogenase family protein [Actinomycetota bacterium]